MHREYARLIALVLILVQPRWVHAEQLPKLSAAELLQRSESSLLRHKNYRCHDELWQSTRGDWIKGGISWEYRSGTFNNEASGRWSWTEVMWRNLPSKDAELKPEQKQGNINLWLPEEHALYMVAVYPAAMTKAAKAPGVVSVSRLAPPEAERLRRSAVAQELDGDFAEEVPLVQFLMRFPNLEVKDATEPINGSQCYAVESRSQQGKYFLWIDAAHGFNVARAEWRKDGNDLLGGVALPRPGVMPGTSIVSSSGAFEVKRWDKIGETWVAAEATDESQLEFKGGRMTKSSGSIQRSHVILNPDFAASGAFEKNFPNGAHAVGPDARPGVPYMWSNGKIVLKVDSATTQAIAREVEDIRKRNTNGPAPALVPSATQP